MNQIIVGTVSYTHLDVYKRQMYDHTVEEYPQMLYSADTKDIHHYGNTPYYNLNQNASEYYKGHENKLALYATHDWDITDQWNVYYGCLLYTSS